MKDFKKPESAELKKKLSSEQFKVTQQCGTEPAFHNPYGTITSPVFMSTCLGRTIIQFAGQI